jgi:shikimate 5-dehydrogenase
MSDSAMHTLTRLTLESLQVFNRTSARVRRAARGRSESGYRIGTTHVFRATILDLYDVSILIRKL